MNDHEYRSTQDRLLIVASLVKELDLDDFLGRIDSAEALGSLVDPSLYVAVKRNLETIKNIALAANDFRVKVLAQTGPAARMERRLM